MSNARKARFTAEQLRQLEYDWQRAEQLLAMAEASAVQTAEPEVSE